MPLIHISHLSHQYPSRTALDDLNLSINSAEIFGFLGPNGSGKTTLFRILSTLIPPTRGDVRLSGLDVVRDRDAIRHLIGVVFQSPSLDKQLTAEENLRHHGHLYGLRGEELDKRITHLLARVGLDNRPRELVGKYSGGMRRRVELAKGLLTNPRILLLDEPSTGLDPAARIELWRYLRQIREEDGVTILVTTHLMDEAEHCDRLAILDSGKLAACDTPEKLKSLIGADVITLVADDPQDLAAQIQQRFGDRAQVVESTIRIERPRAHEFIPQLVEAFVGRIQSVSLGKPTLEDVFIHVTGHAFRESETREEIARPTTNASE